MGNYRNSGWMERKMKWEMEERRMKEKRIDGERDR
jgi:hypothetical protein